MLLIFNNVEEFQEYLCTINFDITFEKEEEEENINLICESENLISELNNKTKLKFYKKHLLITFVFYSAIYIVYHFIK